MGNDVFRVIVASEPRKELTHKVMRRSSSKNNALFLAQARTAQLLGNQHWTTTIHWADINGAGYPRGVLNGNEIHVLSKSGRVVCEEFYSLDRCLIICEVRLKCLKYNVKWELKNQQDECR